MSMEITTNYTQLRIERNVRHINISPITGIEPRISAKQSDVVTVLLRRQLNVNVLFIKLIVYMYLCPTLSHRRGRLRPWDHFIMTQLSSLTYMNNPFHTTSYILVTLDPSLFENITDLNVTYMCF